MGHTPFFGLQAKIMQILARGEIRVYWKLYPVVPFCYPGIIRSELEGCDSILDLGCGSFPVTTKIGLELDCSTGIEVVPERAARAKNYVNHVIIADIRNLEFNQNSFDAVLAIDVIEHLAKIEALSLISSMKKWARKKVVIVTPTEELVGFVDQDLPLNFRDAQRHKCLFSAKELEELGFRVYGVRGIKYLKYDFRKKISGLKIISLLTQPVVKNRPELAAAVLGILDV